MKEAKYCSYRVPGMQAVRDVQLSSHVVVESELIDKCLILDQLGAPDTNCYNPDLCNSSCPLSPDYQGEKRKNR